MQDLAHTAHAAPLGWADDDPTRTALSRAHRAPEAALAAELAAEARLSSDAAARAVETAQALARHARAARRNDGGVDRFMHEYALSSEEGVALMCVAEALLRIPDAATADALIEDKIAGANWDKHLGAADSLFVNASTLGLMVTGRVLRAGEAGGLAGALGRLVQRSGEPVIRVAVRQAMRILGRQFVLGRTIEEAIGRAKSEGAARASFDMLGEAARTEADARAYHEKYLAAVAAVAAARGQEGQGGPEGRHGVSVKLSALHPRYERAQMAAVDGPVYERLLEIAEAAAAADIGLCVDAEEADRLEISLRLIERLAQEPSLKGWRGLGMAMQAYQRRARALVDWIADLARRADRRLMVRLVKGAYWDAEIKIAQAAGHADFPVFTRKAHTDVSYIACARALFAAGPALYPCFATHNAHSLAAVLELGADRPPAGPDGWELQRLHGMGGPLYAGLAAEKGADAPPARVYAPVGGHEELLAYLVRRLLENGANSSFVNRLVDDASPVEEITRDPVDEASAAGFQPHPRIAAPAALFAPRVNSAGWDLADETVVERLNAEVAALEAGADPIEAQPLLAEGASRGDGPRREIRSPADRSRLIGVVREASTAEASAAMAAAAAAQPAWDAAGADARAAVLERAADLYEANAVRLMRLAVREAGKTWPDAVAELREAVDFLRFYAAEARRLMPEAALPGPTGETNALRLAGRGVAVCISPWNFPLAIFTGQVAAALAAGNAVVAKPAEQTPLIAHAAVELLRRAGAPRGVLQLAPGDGAALGPVLIDDPRLALVAFTGSTDVAKLINRQLAARDGPIVPLIAETGGINAMIVDSSALPEQVTRDVVASAFQSAGQRCSAARVLYLQEEIAERQLDMIRGAMDALRVGDPMRLATDVGPVIDAEALQTLEAHVAALESAGAVLHRAPAPPEAAGGFFMRPTLARVEGIAAVEREAFGPVLHVATFPGDGVDAVVDAINGRGYGLTLGVHSRVEGRWRRIAALARVGNVYVNRNQIGAIVGSQPFGGEGLSGTGPKAGGPHTLARFAVERTLSVDVAAQGGDAALMAMDM